MVQINNKKTSINTHDYDGSLTEEYQKYLEIDNEKLKKPMSFQKTIEKILNESKKLEDNTLRRNVNKSCNLMLKDRQNNYDNINKINVEDLLPRTWRFISFYDDFAKECFFEQLADIITSGSCSQGRVTRVYQFYNNHMETQDEIYQKCLIN